jgi:hypothetical protein
MELQNFYCAIVLIFRRYFHHTPWLQDLSSIYKKDDEVEFLREREILTEADEIQKWKEYNRSCQWVFYDQEIKLYEVVKFFCLIYIQMKKCFYVFYVYFLAQYF